VGLRWRAAGGRQGAAIEPKVIAGANVMPAPRVGATHQAHGILPGGVKTRHWRPVLIDDLGVRLAGNAGK